MPEAEILMFAALLIAILDGILFYLNESTFKNLKKVNELLTAYYENCDKKNDECIKKANHCVDVVDEAVKKCNECVDYTNELVKKVNEGRQEK